jgi:hypothetical protein
MKMLEAHGLADTRTSLSVLHRHLLSIEEDQRALRRTNGADSDGR